MSRKKQVYEKITALYCRISLDAVSYTHLDVYKRQAWKYADFERFSDVLDIRERASFFGKLVLADRQDVYKRQR